MNPPAEAILNKPKGKSQLVFWLSFSGILVVILAIVAYVLFFVYLPNTPENRYRRGLGSVGAGMQYLIDNGFLDDIVSTGYKGEIVYNYESNDLNLGVNIDIDGSYDTESALFNMSVSADGSDREESYQTSGDVEFRFLSGDEDVAPRLFLKFSDLTFPAQIEEDADQELTKSLDEIEGVWWLLDFQELLDEGTFTDGDAQSLDLSQQLSQQELEQFFLIAINALREYVFTDDVDKMVFQMDEKLGEEDFNGVASHKYSVTVNEDNLEAYITQLRDEFIETDYWQKINKDANIDLTEEFSNLNIKEMVEEFSEDTKVEVWVDDETGVLRNLRISDGDKESESFGSYLDFGVSIEDDVMSLSLKLETFDLWSQCSTDDLCPYVLEELPEGLKCDDPYSNPKFDNRYEDDDVYEQFYDALDEYDYTKCSDRSIVSLKEGAQSYTTMEFGLKIDTEKHKINYDMSFIFEGGELLVNLELVGQEDAVNAQAPEEYESIFDLFDDNTTYDNTDSALARNDIAYLRAALDIYVSNNSGRLPEGSQPADEMEDVFGEELNLGYHYMGDVIYFGSDFDPDDDTEPLIEEAGSFAYYNVHIWVGYSCSSSAASLSEDSQTILQESTSRSVAYVFVNLDEIESMRCEDNA